MVIFGFVYFVNCCILGHMLYTRPRGGMVSIEETNSTGSNYIFHIENLRLFVRIFWSRASLQEIVQLFSRRNGKIRGTKLSGLRVGRS